MVLSLVSFVGAGVVTSRAQTLMTRHVREASLNGEAMLTGRLPHTQILQLDVVLPLRDSDGLDALLAENATNPRYRHYLTPTEFTERFGPSPQDYNAVVRFLQDSGLTVVGGLREGMDVQFRGPVSAIESAFHVNLLTLAGAMNSEATMGSNIVLTGFSAGASDIASTWNSLPASTRNQVIAINLVSPGIPWGVPTFTNANGPVPTYTFQSLNSSGVPGLEDNLVNASNGAPFALGIGPPPVYPGGVTQIDGPGHDFGGENGQIGILPTTSDCPSVISSVTTWDPDANRDEEAAIQARLDIFAPTDESYVRGQ